MFWRVFWLRSTCLKVDCKGGKAGLSRFLNMTGHGSLQRDPGRGGMADRGIGSGHMDQGQVVLQGQSHRERLGEARLMR